MKKFFIALSLIYSIGVSANPTESKLYEVKLSNGINIVLYENFNFPVVMVGVLYDVGAIEASKAAFAVNYFVENSLFSPSIKYDLIENGISYSVNVHAGYTELTAVMQPKSVSAFFQDVVSVSPKVTNFDYTKEQIKLQDKLQKITDADAIYNYSMGLLGNDTSKLIFNETNLAELTNKDLSKFLEKYCTCNIRIIVCGAISHRGLLRALKNSVLKMKTRRQLTSKYLEKKALRTVLIEGHLRENSLKMYYLVPSSFSKSRAYWAIFSKLMEDFFQGEYAYASYFDSSSYLYYGNYVQAISLWPKEDVSLNQLQKLYDAFVIKILHEPPSSNFLLQVANTHKDYIHCMKNDLFGVYELIKKSLFNGGNIKNIFEYTDDITEMTPNNFINISSDIIDKNYVLKVIEKYKVKQ